MRNHRKIKAVRNKFKIAGYGLWCMILEYLTGIDGNVFEYSDLEFELMSGDFGVSGAEIRQLVDYCVGLELLFLKEGFIHSESLDERLFPVYEKRRVKKGFSSKQLRNNGKFAVHNTASSGVSAPESTQSKVKESKVKYNTTNSKEFVEEKISPVIGVIEKKKAPLKKKARNPDSEPYWKEIRAKWVWFNKTHLKFNPEPMPSRDYSHLHRIIEKVRERTVGEALSWTKEVALEKWERFLTVAYTKDDWLPENFLLSNLETKMQKVFNLIENPNGHPKTTTGKSIEFDRP